MEARIKELTVKLRENEDLLQFIARNQLPLTEGGYTFLIDQILALKTELARLEAEERKALRRLLIMN